MSWKSLKFFARTWLCGSALLVGAYSAEAAPAVPPRSTIAFQLLDLERLGGSPPVGAEAFLEKILVEAYEALGDAPRPPATAAEFRKFAETVSISLARKNFLQPSRMEDWPDSLGAAFRQLPNNHPGLPGSKSSLRNSVRLGYANPAAPFRYLDCDMGALIIISVAQMVGFELNLVEVPEHNFVRWHGPDGSVNWDWTKWGSFPDSDYERGISEIQLVRKTYLASQTADQAMGYYLAVVTRNISLPEMRLKLRRDALNKAPTNPIVANNVAWSFATLREGVQPADRRNGVALALSAWASNPSDTNFMETAACAFAAAGEKAMALSIVARAEARSTGSTAANLGANRERIDRGEPCR